MNGGVQKLIMIILYIYRVNDTTISYPCPSPSQGLIRSSPLSQFVFKYFSVRSALLPLSLCLGVFIWPSNCVKRLSEKRGEEENVVYDPACILESSQYNWTGSSMANIKIVGKSYND